MRTPKRDNTAALVVTFHPDCAIGDRLARIAALVETVIVVDNHSAPDEVEMLRAASTKTGAQLVENPANLGIAAALNRGMEIAMAAGRKWILAFDQDTDPEPDLLERIADVFDALPEPERVAVLAANYRHAGHALGGYLPADIRFEPGKPWGEAVMAITSGSLFSAEPFRRIGPFREELFIDHVDTEYCFRARRMGYRIVITRDVLMEHSVGALTPHRLAGRRVWTFQYSPLRWYYRARNHVVVIRGALLQDPKWCLRTSWAELKSLAKVALLEDDRARKLAHAARGVWHGLTRNFGWSPRPEPDARRGAAPAAVQGSADLT